MTLEQDIIQTLYKELFMVRLRHSSYEISFNTGSPPPVISSSVFNEMTIVPDSATEDLFTACSMDYRCMNSSLICFLRTERLTPPATNPQIPFIPLDGNITIRFLVYVSADFLKRSKVAAAGSKQVYQFSNQSNAGTSGFLMQQTTGVSNADLKAVTVVRPERTCFAVIDVSNFGAVNSSYDLFGANQRLLSPEFSIVFNPV